MTGYDKLRETISDQIDDMDDEYCSQATNDILSVITAAGIPIEDLANGKKVAVPREPTERQLLAAHVEAERALAGYEKSYLHVMVLRDYMWPAFLAAALVEEGDDRHILECKRERLAGEAAIAALRAEPNPSDAVVEAARRLIDSPDGYGGEYDALERALTTLDALPAWETKG